MAMGETWAAVGKGIDDTGVIQGTLYGFTKTVELLNSILPNTAKVSSEVKNRWDDMAGSAKITKNEVSALSIAAGGVKEALSSVGNESRQQLGDMGQHAKATNELWKNTEEQVKAVTEAIKKQEDAILGLTKAQIEAKNASADDKDKKTDAQIQVEIAEAERKHAMAVGRGEMEAIKKERDALAKADQEMSERVQSKRRILDMRAATEKPALEALSGVGYSKQDLARFSKRGGAEADAEINRLLNEVDAQEKALRFTDATTGVQTKAKLDAAKAEADKKVPVLKAFRDARGGEKIGYLTAKTDYEQSQRALETFQEGKYKQVMSIDQSERSTVAKMNEQQLKDYAKREQLKRDVAKKEETERAENMRFEEGRLSRQPVQTVADEEQRQRRLADMKLARLQSKANLAQTSEEKTRAEKELKEAIVRILFLIYKARA
jgi:hypothetical protein